MHDLTLEQARTYAGNIMRSMQKARSNLAELDLPAEVIERVQPWLQGERGDTLLGVLAEMAHGSSVITGMEFTNVMVLVNANSIILIPAQAQGAELPPTGDEGMTMYTIDGVM